MNSNLDLSNFRNTIDRLLTNTNEPVDKSLSILRGMVNYELSSFHKRIHTLLVDVVTSQRIILSALGESWLTDGAQAFAIWDHELLFCWPESMELDLQTYNPMRVTLQIPIHAEGRKVARVGVIGPSELNEKARLGAETALLARIVAQRIEMEAMQKEITLQRQIQNEMDLAANLQLRLLPQTFPAVQGLDLYAHSAPAKHVGGDFYLFTPHQQGNFLFAAGDVSGKGLPAALLMAMTRIVMSAASRFIPSVHPRLLINRVNEDLYDDFTELGMFTTIFAGSYDHAAQQIVYANAGQAPVVYCPFDGPACLLEADAPAVGILPFTMCENATIPFRPGDVLVVATDGFNEAVNSKDEMYGYERFMQTVKELSPLQAEEIGQQLFSSVVRFSTGQEQSDDQTLIVLKGVDS